MRYFVFGLLALVGCVLVRTPVILSDVQFPFTHCDFLGSPYIQINKLAAKDTVSFRAMLAHEYTHAKRMEGRCKNFMKRYMADEDFRLQEEIAAFCASVEFYVKRGQDRSVLVEQMVNDLDLLYRLNKTPEEIFERVTCKGG